MANCGDRVTSHVTVLLIRSGVEYVFFHLISIFLVKYGFLITGLIGWLTLLLMEHEKQLLPFLIYVSHFLHYSSL